MTTKTLQAITCTSIFLIGTILSPVPGIAQRPQKGKLVRQTANPSRASEYFRVALYFHNKELLFRAKAQSTIDWYANHYGKYPMATKTVSRAEAAAQQFNDYSSKADESARMAAAYQQMLSEIGCKPADFSAVVVSIETLYQTFTGESRTVGN